MRLANGSRAFLDVCVSVTGRVHATGAERARDIDFDAFPGDEGRRDGHILAEGLPEARLQSRHRDQLRRRGRGPEARPAPRGAQAHGQDSGLRGVQRCANEGSPIIVAW